MPSLKLVLRVCSSHNGLIQKTSLPIKVSFLVEYFLKRLYPLTWDQSHKVTKQFDSRHSIRLNLVIWLLFVITTNNKEATLRLSILLAISALISAQKDIIAQVLANRITLLTLTDYWSWCHKAVWAQMARQEFIFQFTDKRWLKPLDSFGLVKHEKSVIFLGL